MERQKPDTEAKPVSGRLRDALERSGVSVSELARRYAGKGATPKQVENARRYINKVLAGEVMSPSTPIARKLAKLLREPPESFVTTRPRRAERLAAVEQRLDGMADRLEELADALDALRKVVEEQAHPEENLPAARSPS